MGEGESNVFCDWIRKVLLQIYIDKQTGEVDRDFSRPPGERKKMHLSMKSR